MDDVPSRRIRLEVDAAVIALIEHEERTQLGYDGLVPEREAGTIAEGSVEDDSRPFAVEGTQERGFFHG
jgi:hypothetical protein